MFGGTVLLTLALLLSGPPPQGEGDRVTLDVIPSVSTAPATARILALVRPEPANRTLVIEASSPDYFRLSELPLDGECARRTHVIEYDGLPAGHYVITATIVDAEGDPLAEAVQKLDVVGRP